MTCSQALRQIDLDFHTSEHIPYVGEDFDGAAFAENPRNADVESVVLFAKCHHGWSHYEGEVGEPHPSLDFDLLQAQCGACKSAGLKTPIYVSVGWDERNETILTRPGALKTSWNRAVSSASYIYASSDFSLALLGTWVAGPRIIHDKDVVALDGDGLVYETQTFKTDIEFIGAPELKVWISIDTPDTDIRARLYEVTAGGVSIRQSADRICARYRADLTNEKLIEPGAIEEYLFDAFILKARRIAAGNRIRLVIDAPNSVYEQHTFNAGRPITEVTLGDARPVTIMLYEDITYKTTLSLPLRALDK